MHMPAAHIYNHKKNIKDKSETKENKHENICENDLKNNNFKTLL